MFLLSTAWTLSHQTVEVSSALLILFASVDSLTTLSVDYFVPPFRVFPSQPLRSSACSVHILACLIRLGMALRRRQAFAIAALSKPMRSAL